MKNFIKWIGIIALVAVVGFSFASCKGADAAEPTSATYKSFGSDGNIYELKITKDPNRAAYKPQAGDTYELTITFPDKTETETSSGTVAGGSVDSGFTLKPSGSETTFTVTVSSEKMTKISGTITTNQGTVLQSQNLFPVTGGSDKFLTITGIPTTVISLNAQVLSALFKDKPPKVNPVAASDDSFYITEGTITFALKKPNEDNAWTGTGEYYVFIQAFGSGTKTYVTKEKVNFTKESTVLKWDDFTLSIGYDMIAK